MTTPEEREPTRIDARGIRPPPAFTIEQASGHAGAALIVLHGEVDLAATAPLRARVDAVTAPALVVDLSQVTFFDSSALRELLYARQTLAARGARLVLAGIPRNVFKLLELTGTSTLFDTAPTRDEAMRRLASA